MPVPKKKTSTSKRDMRRSHDAITMPYSVTCKNCGAPKLLHRICPSCGFYRGKEMIVMATEEEDTEATE